MSSFFQQLMLMEASDRQEEDTWVANQLRLVAAQAKAGQPLTPGQWKGQPLLHVLVEQARKPGLKKALTSGCPAGTTNARGVTPLHLAAKNDQPGLVQLLLEHGAPVDVRDNTGKTPLHWAANSTHGTAVEALVKAGADLEAHMDTHITPLFLAAGGSPGPLRALLALGADITAVTGGNDTVLSSAVMADSVECLDLLLAQGCDINQREGSQWTPLQLAINRGYYQIFDRLLEQGAEVAQPGPQRDPLFHMMAQHDHMDWALRLLRAGADPSVVDDQHRSVDDYLAVLNEPHLTSQWKKAVLEHRLPAAPSRPSPRF